MSVVSAWVGISLTHQQTRVQNGDNLPLLCAQYTDVWSVCMTRSFIKLSKVQSQISGWRQSALYLDTRMSAVAAWLGISLNLTRGIQNTRVRKSHPTVAWNKWTFYYNSEQCTVYFSSCVKSPVDMHIWKIILKQRTLGAVSFSVRGAYCII